MSILLISDVFFTVLVRVSLSSLTRETIKTTVDLAFRLPSPLIIHPSLTLPFPMSVRVPAPTRCPNLAKVSYTEFLAGVINLRCKTPEALNSGLRQHKKE